MPALSAAAYALIALAVTAALSAAAWALRQREVPWRLVHSLRLVMVGALSIGTCTHLENTWRAGYMPLPEQPLVFNLYWTSLTVFDPLAALLLVLRPRLGLGLGIAIKISDVAINACAFPPTAHLSQYWPFWLQVAFATFLFAVSPYCWRQLAASTKPR